MTRGERNELALTHAALVRTVVRYMAPHLPRHCETEDLVACGMVALLEALEKYQSVRSAQIVPYLRYKIRLGILGSLRSVAHNRRVGDPPKFEALIPEYNVPVGVPKQERETLGREAWDAVEQLPVRWRLVMRLYYQHEYTMQDCGHVLGVNVSRISQIHAAAVRRLRGILAA